MKDFIFKKKFGQNFISDKNLLGAIASDAEISQEDEVLEIGAGAGSLTSVLSERAKNVVSFEIDKDLKEHLLSLNLKNVDFVFDDFMNVKMQDIDSMFKKDYKVVANLPYYITSPVISRLLEIKNVKTITIMVQKEVADRIIAKKGTKDYGILTLMIGLVADAEIMRHAYRNITFHFGEMADDIGSVTIVACEVEVSAFPEFKE